MSWVRCQYVSERDPGGCPKPGHFWTGTHLLCKAHAMAEHKTLETWNNIEALAWALANAPWLVMEGDRPSG